MRKLILVLLIATFSIPSFGQSRSYIKEKIKSWDECKNVAITQAGGDLCIRGRNTWAGKGLPSNLVSSMNKLRDRGELIDDVQLTEDGSWLILYGDNGFIYYDLPSSLQEKIKEYNDDNEVITSVTFNDEEDWIVISEDNISTSSTSITDMVKEGLDDYGQLWAAHLTDDGMVLCYEGGYYFYGNVPQVLKDKLKSTDIDVYRLKFLSDGAYFIADKSGRYSYYL